MSLPSLDQPFVRGSVDTPIGQVPQVASELARADRLGSYKARWGIGRMHYTVEPGLYALGRPNTQSPVLVTANYKMSFDRLRSVLSKQDSWILVLDTKGINVWCAAGKGTLGTMELVNRIEASRLDQIVAHRQLIVPQLAGPGIAAHEVKKLSGFKVVYGPIKASDLPAFLGRGMKASPEMRIKTFTIGERAVLIPVELVTALKVGILSIMVLFGLSGILGPEGFWQNVSHRGLFALPAVLTAILGGAVLAPLLLPWLPGRPFSLKGLPLGILGALALLVFRWGDLVTWSTGLDMLAWFLLIPAATTYLSMNFTGASTYTSLSGVRKEMKWALPFQIGAGVVGLVFWFSSIFSA